MDLSSIGGLGGASAVGGAGGAITKPSVKFDEGTGRLTDIKEPMGDFGAVLKDAVSSLSALGAKADANAVTLATGGNIDIHEVMLSMEHASLGMQTALQVRNKLVDAYQEIMRMSV